MEYLDIYDENRRLTGRIKARGEALAPGEYVLVVCVWVHDGHGRLLLTRRSPEKSFPLQWENSGGAAQAGESSLEAIARELREETGIEASAERFLPLGTRRDESGYFIDYYALEDRTPVERLRLLPGETVEAKWVSFRQAEEMIRSGEMVEIIGRRFRQDKQQLLRLQKIGKKAP